MHKDYVASSKNASLYPIMLGCCIDASILTSFKAFYFSLLVNFPILTFFIAYISFFGMIIEFSGVELAVSSSPELIISSDRELDDNKGAILLTLKT
jgi:hypothetical protein